MKTMLMLSVLTFWLFGQVSSLSSAQQNEPTIELVGRVVLFDWGLHTYEARYAEDLVVRVHNPVNSEEAYVRIVYVGVAELAPEELKAKYRLNNALFVGRGTLWKFRLRRPQAHLDVIECGTTYEFHTVSDELGTAKIPRYFPSPGAIGENVPAVSTLPCYLMTDKPTKEKFGGTR